MFGWIFLPFYTLFLFAPSPRALVVAIRSVCKLEGGSSMTVVVLDGK